MLFFPLHNLVQDKPLQTAGRLRKKAQRWQIFNAHAAYFLQFADPILAKTLCPGALIRLNAIYNGQDLTVHDLEICWTPSDSAPPQIGPTTLPLGAALRARHLFNKQAHHFFQSRGFLEVETPAWTRAPGTDPHLEPVAADFVELDHRENTQGAYLHTSPEFKMKRLLASGSGPIYQLTKVWRNGEVSPLHNPEFTILEWYRPWQSVDEIIQDVEDLVCMTLHKESPRFTAAPIRRMTMQEIVFQACGFDILDALDAKTLREVLKSRNLLSPRLLKAPRWDELFFALAVEKIDPFLATLGAVFVTHWPTPLSILARRDKDDPRVAERFELYIDGIELANGFGELTDPVEQRARFEEDNQARRELGLKEIPLPKAFLKALEWGLPPSAGVALGVDRLLILATQGASTISDIAPFALYRQGSTIIWP